jgi:hypothetical protein
MTNPPFGFSEEDPNGHPYHSLAYGDPDGPEEEVMMVDFYRMNPPIDGDTYAIKFQMHGVRVVVPRSIILEALNYGWNYEFSDQEFFCDHKHELYQPEEEPEGE